jgi:hypothetical protein
LFFAGDRLTPRALPAPGVGVGPLAANRQPATMPHTAIAPDFDQALDVHGNLATEIATDSIDIRKADLDPFAGRQINACDTCH